MFLLSSLYSLAQHEGRILKAGAFELIAVPAKKELSEAFNMIGELPVFPGEEKGLFSFLKQNLIYPKSAIKDEVQGRVRIQFKVDTTGKAIEEKIIQGVRLDLDTICLAAVRKMPLWKPGKINQQPVEVQFILPVNFVLVEEKRKKK